MLYFLLLGGAFLTALFFVAGFYQLLYGSRLAVLQRLDESTADQVAAAPAREYSRGKGLWRELLQLFGMLGNRLSRQGNLPALQQKLNQAHILMRAEELVGVSMVAALLVTLLVYLLAQNVLFALPAGLAASRLPVVFVEMQKQKRQQALTGQLPEALDIVTSGLRAGFSFPQALAVVSKELPPPIAEEFSRVLRENRMGKPMEEALQNLGGRTDSEDLDLVITVLLIQRQVGGNLAEILGNIAHTIRERVRISGQIKTLTAQGKLSALVILLLPPALALYLFVVNPDYILTLVRDTLGLAMLGGAVVLQFLGIIIIRRIIQIDI